MLTLTTVDGRTEFEPGETFEVIARWQFSRRSGEGELRLLWETSGKGTTESSLLANYSFMPPALEGSQRFRVTLPSAPYSFSGKLVSLLWYVELEFEDINEQTRLEITVAPLGKEVLLHPAEAASHG